MGIFAIQQSPSVESSPTLLNANTVKKIDKAFLIEDEADGKSLVYSSCRQIMS